MKTIFLFIVAVLLLSCSPEDQFTESYVNYINKSDTIYQEETLSFNNGAYLSPEINVEGKYIPKNGDPYEDQGLSIALKSDNDVYPGDIRVCLEEPGVGGIYYITSELTLGRQPDGYYVGTFTPVPSSYVGFLENTKTIKIAIGNKKGYKITDLKVILAKWYKE